MSRQGESFVAEDCLDYLQELSGRGVPIYWEHRSGSGGFAYKKGIPDLFIVVSSTHIECELKTPVGKRSTMQIKWAQRFLKNGIPYICPHSFQEFKEFIDNYIQ